MQWKILDTGAHSAQENMQIDADLLRSLRREDPPTLRLYDWMCPAVTVGYFIKPEQHLHLTFLQKEGFQVVKRPTGGGIVFHHVDFSFSLFIPVNYPGVSPTPVENYRLVHRLFLPLLDRIHKEEKGNLLAQDDPIQTSSQSAFCMARPTQYDLLYRGKKVGGAAQRRTKEGFLHQGTLCLCIPPVKWLAQALVQGSSLANAMWEKSYPLQTAFLPDMEVPTMRQHLRSAFFEYFPYLNQ